MTRSRTIRIFVPLAVLLGLVTLFAVVGKFSGGGASSGSSATSAAPKSRAISAERSAFGGADTVVAGAADGGTSTANVAATIPAASAPSAHYLVRNGALTLVVARGSLPRAVDRVTALTTGMGGYVVSSSLGSEPIPWPLGAEPALDGQSSPPSGGDQAVTSTGDGYATITVRVPEDQFDTALRRYAALGEVRGVSTSSEDVTTQYVDLVARLDHYRAVERRLVRFLAATSSVPQMLAVQDRLDKVQLTIEQLTAELKALRETTTYGTITVSLSEKGRTHAVAAGTSFWGTFWHSMQLLGRGARATAFALVAVLPFLVVFGGVAVVAWFAARRFRRRRQPPQPSLPV